MHSLCFTYFKDYLSTRFLFVLELFQKLETDQLLYFSSNLILKQKKINFAMFTG